MKLIITGATGLIGGGALRNALENPSVSSVIVLARRDTGLKHEKLQTIIKTDFSTYTTEELEQLKGADACVWALGSPTQDATVHVDYPTAARNAFITALAPQTSAGKPFRFILLSGSFVTQNQEKWLPSGMSILKARGQVEKDFQDCERQHPKIWRSVIVRPALVLRKGAWLGYVAPGKISIPVDTFGAALVSIAEDDGGRQVFNNAMLREVGTRHLANV